MSNFPIPFDCEENEADREEEKCFEQQTCEHSYKFKEILNSDQNDVHLEKWECISCGHERELRINIGVLDY